MWLETIQDKTQKKSGQTFNLISFNLRENDANSTIIKSFRISRSLDREHWTHFSIVSISIGVLFLRVAEIFEKIRCRWRALHILFFSHSSDARSVVKSSYVCVFVFEIEFEIILIQENRRCAMVVNCDKFVAKNHNVLDEINDFDSESDCDGR